MPKKKRKSKDRYVEYYEKVLLQFLGFEKEIYTTGRINCYVFYHYPIGKMILYTKANKIQQCKSRKWVDHADEYIVRVVLKEKDIPSYTKFISGEQGKIRFS